MSRKTEAAPIDGFRLWAARGIERARRLNDGADLTRRARWLDALPDGHRGLKGVSREDLDGIANRLRAAAEDLGA